MAHFVNGNRWKVQPRVVVAAFAVGALALSACDLDNSDALDDAEAAEARAQDDAERLRDDLDGLDADYATLQSELVDLDAELGTLRDDLAAAEEGAEESADQVSALEVQLADAEDENDSLREEYDPLIRAGIQAEVGAAVIAACGEAQEHFEAPVAGLVTFNAAWSSVTSEPDVIAQVEDCAAPVRDLPDGERSAAGLDAFAGTTAEIVLPASQREIAVTDVVDGDTIDTNIGTIRIIGYDTPERGEPCFTEASDALSSLLASGTVTVAAQPGDDDTDQYGRLLRHVYVDGTPVGLPLIRAGLANARYDSHDGYGAHQYETVYRNTDASVDDERCGVPVEAVAPAAAPAATEPAPSPAAAPATTPPPEPAPAPTPAPAPAPAPAPPAERAPDIAPSGPDLDCGDIGRKVWVGNNDYHRLDADGDGWGCESYG